MKSIIQNIWRIIKWIPVLWSNYDWDPSFLYEVIGYKLKQMELNTYRWHVADAEIRRKQIKTARILCNRLVDELYTYENKNSMSPVYKPKKRWNLSNVRKQYDLNMLCDYIRRYSCYWWD